MKSIRILHLEDSLEDADLIGRELRKGGIDFEVTVVSARDEFEQALKTNKPDVILSDHSLPQFNSLQALTLVKAVSPGTPFILVTATVSDMFAVSLIKSGAEDYVLKDRLQRLPVAVKNALEKKDIESEIQRKQVEIASNERKFREAHERLMFHLENSSLGFIEWDQQLKIKACSRRAEEIFGWTIDELRFNSLTAPIPVFEEDVDMVAAITSKLLSGEVERNTIQHRNIKKDGSVIWCEWSHSVLRDLEGDVVTIMSLVQDITDRKRGEEKLLNSQANLSAIIENADAFIYSLDRDFRYITFNTAMKDAVRAAYGIEIAPGMKVYGFMGPNNLDEMQAWQDTYKLVLEGKPQSFVKDYSTPEFPAFVSFSLNPIVENEQVTGISCFSRDITRQHLAAKKLSESEERFRALIENSYDAIVLRDKAFKVLYASPSAKKILGYEASDVMEANFLETIHALDQDLVSKVQSELVHHPGKPFFLNFRKKRKSGDYVWVEGVMTSMLEVPGINGIISNFRDITERKRLEEERINLMNQLVDQNNDLMQFSFIASHNLRGPVATLLGLTNLLGGDQGREESDEIIRHVKQTTQILDGIIGDMSDIVNIRANKDHVNEWIDVHQVVKKVQNALKAQIAEQHVQFETQGIEITAFQTVKPYIESIFYNLVSNAIKFRSPQRTPVVKIRTYQENDRIMISVSDNGTGIDLSKFSEKLFGMYQRFTTEVEGRGLGLYIVKAQVKALSGNISVESECGAGTTFVIQLQQNYQGDENKLTA